MTAWKILLGALLTGMAWVQGVRAAPPQAVDEFVRWRNGVEKPVDEGGLRLDVILVRVPKAEAARLLMEDHGAGTPWEARLVELHRLGKLKVARRWITEARGQQRIWKDGRSEMYHSVHLFYGSRFWRGLQVTKEEQLEDLDVSELLTYGLHEVEVGSWLNGEFNWDPELEMVDWKVELQHSLAPVLRPTTTWPIPMMSLNRVIARPWSLTASGRSSCGEVFLMGAQMDTRGEGEEGGLEAAAVASRKGLALGPVTKKWDEEVTLAFGRMTDAKTQVEQPPKGEGFRLQAWTLAVDAAEFLPWANQRRDSVDDEAALSKWLREAAGEGNDRRVELLSCGAVVASKGRPATADSKWHWQDAASLEPGGTAKEFRPMVGEAIAETYLWHHLQAEVNQREEVAADPFAAQPRNEPQPQPRRDGRTVWVDLAMQRPSMAARWIKWKCAMEREDEDPWSVEIAEGDNDRGPRGEAIDLSDVEMKLDRALMVSAGMKEGRVHATFVRVVGAGQKVPAEEWRGVDGTLTTWMIETPLDWWKAGQVGADPVNLAKRLLTAVDGKTEGVKVKGLMMQPMVVNEKGHQMGRPHLSMGDYLNTSEHAAGIFYYPTQMERQLVGSDLSWRRIYSEAEHGEMPRHGAKVQWTIQGDPQWRRWGAWVEGAKVQGAEKSGFELPVFPHASVDVNAELAPHMAQVVAMTRISQWGLQREQPEKAKLQWWVVRLNREREPGPEPIPIPEVKSVVKKDAFGLDIVPIIDSIPSPSLVQALVLKRGLKDRELVPEVWEKALAEGEVEALDAAMLACSGVEVESVQSGTFYRFPNSRHLDGRSRYEDAVMDAEAEMEEEVRYAGTVNLRERKGGLMLKVHKTGWQVEWDAKEPVVVDDVFDGVDAGWPVDRRVDRRKMPKFTVIVQRPIFSVKKAEGELPEMGKAMVRPLGDEAVLLVRRLAAGKL